MPFVQIVDVEAPKKVLPNLSFFIKWKLWYFTWPFKKITLYTNIRSYGVLLMEKYTTIKPWWFWGTVSYQVEVPGITEGLTFVISAGYD